MEIVKTKQQFLQNALDEGTCIFKATCAVSLVCCLFFVTVLVLLLHKLEDIKEIDTDQRHCVAHSATCSLPDRLEVFAAGFSCTSYSPLNSEAPSNTTAMTEQRVLCQRLCSELMHSFCQCEMFVCLILFF